MAKNILSENKEDVKKILSISNSKPNNNNGKEFNIQSNLASDKKFVSNVAKKSIEEQLKYMKEYIASPKFKDRLKKQLNTEKKIGGNYTDILNVFAGKKITSQKELNDRVNSIIEKSKKQSEILKNKNINVGDFAIGPNVGAEYQKDTGKININENALKDVPTIPIHEISHAVSDGKDPYSYSFKEKFLDKILQPTHKLGDPYVQTPTEIKARLDAIRFLAKKKGIYDAGKQDITKEVFKKLISDKEIKNDKNFKEINGQLKENYKENGMIWLLNNIAKNKTTENTNQTV